MIRLKKIKKFFKKLVWLIGENYKFTFLFLFLLALILAGLIFYKYSYLAEKAEPSVVKKPLEFKEDLFQQVSRVWQTRQEKFEKAESKEYPNLFQLQLPPPETTPEELTE